MEKWIMTLPSEFSSSSPDHMLQQCSTCAVSKKMVCVNKWENKKHKEISSNNVLSLLLFEIISNKTVNLNEYWI